MTTINTPPLLAVKNLKSYFNSESGVVKAVDGVDFDVFPGEVLGLVGESGCGKSVTALSILRLVTKPGRIVDGQILFNGRDLLRIPESEMIKLRGNRLTMIFQQPQTSLDPIYTIGDQIAEVYQLHQGLRKQEAMKLAIEFLRIVGIPDPEKKAKAHPHELSGGQAQRVMIAMALALNPDLLIADEPTTALDVTIQAQIIDLLIGMGEKLNMAIILITHDLGIIAEIANRVAVMYAGKIVELAEKKALFANPYHPYTRGLMASIPILGQVKDRLEVIPGNVPNLINLPPGCRFASRCLAREQNNLKICNELEPDLINFIPNHSVRCWLYQDYSSHQALITK